MRQNASGITLASTSHTIVSLNNRRIFATRSSETSITSDIIPRRLKICSVLFFDPYVELFMRGYIEQSTTGLTPVSSPAGRQRRWGTKTKSSKDSSNLPPKTQTPPFLRQHKIEIQRYYSKFQGNTRGN